MRISLFAVQVKVRKSVRQHPGNFFAPGRDCTENRGLLVAQSLLELRAKLVQQASYLVFCENAVADSILACWRNWILGKKAGLFKNKILPDSPGLSRSGCPWLLLAAMHQSEAMLTAGFRGRKTVTVNALQSALSSKSAATVILVHAYDDIVSTVSRTAGEIALLLCAECSAEQAPVLDTDF